MARRGKAGVVSVSSALRFTMEDQPSPEGPVNPGNAFVRIDDPEFLDSIARILKGLSAFVIGEGCCGDFDYKKTAAVLDRNKTSI